VNWLKKLFRKKKIQETVAAKTGEEPVDETVSPVVIPQGEFMEILQKYTDNENFTKSFLLFDPQEKKCYVSILSEDDIIELDVTDLSSWNDILKLIKNLYNKVVYIGENKYSCIVSMAFTNLGERGIVKLFAGDLPCEEDLKEEKRKIIKMVNCRKPATALTRENIEHLLSLLEENGQRTVPELLEHLKEDGNLEEEEFEKIKNISEFKHLLSQPLARKKIVKAVARMLQVEYIDVELIKIDEAFAKQIPVDIAKNLLVVAFEEEGDKVKTAFWNPFDKQAVEQVENVLQKKIIPYMSCEEDLRYEIEKIYQS
jgi:hypothetical protein